MRRGSIIGTIIVSLIVIVVCIYIFGNRNSGTPGNLSLNAVVDRTSDAATTTAVKAALALNNQIASFNIHVETVKDTVTLTGQVPTPDDKRLAETVARSTTGVAGVVNQLEVDPKVEAANAAKQYVTDLEIKSTMLEFILSRPEIKSQQLKVEVHEGELKMSGSVENIAQKNVLEAAALSIANVRKVESSNLTVVNL